MSNNGTGLNLRNGERTVNDLIAPGALEERRDRLVIDGRASRVMALVDYPRSVIANWLEPLLDRDDPIDVSMHVTPAPAADTARMLERQMVKLQSRRMSLQGSGRIASTEADLALRDVVNLRESLERGEERVFQVSAYLRVYGNSPAELDRAAGRVNGVLGSILAAARPALYQQFLGLLSCLPGQQDHLRATRNLDTSSLVTMMPFASSQTGDEQGLLYGTNLQSGSLVILNPFGRENANKVVFARSGSGKSFGCKVEALRALQAGISYFVIDPEGEYEPLAAVLNARTVRMTPGSPQRINPFDLPQNNGDADEVNPFAAHVITLLGLLDLMLAEPQSSLPQIERTMLDEAIFEAYRRKGITDDPDTHDREVPVLSDLVDILNEGDDDYGLAVRLRRYTTGSFAHLFSERTTVDLNHPFVVFDVRDLAPEMRTLATYLIASHIWREVRARPRPRLLLIDEAWMLMQHPSGAEFLSGMARQARKHWLGLITITQDVSDFLNSPHGLTVLANASLKLLMRQDATVIDSVSEVFDLTPLEREFLMSASPGEGLLQAGNDHSLIRIEASPLEYALATTDPSERAAMAAD